MSEKAFVREAKRFAQKRLKEEYGFAPGANEIVVMEEGHARSGGYILVYYVAIAVNGKCYAINNTRIVRMENYNAKNSRR